MPDHDDQDRPHRENTSLMLWQRVRRVVGVVLAQALLLALLALIIPGFRFTDAVAVIPAAAAITLAQSLLWPIVYGIAARFGPLLFPVLSFVLTGALVTFAASLDDRLDVGGVEVADLWTGILVALGLTAGNTLLAALFSRDDEPAYDRFVTEPLRRRYHGVAKSSTSGFLFLEIDGLSEPVLRDAIARGYMPTLGRWLKSGSHTLLRWDPDLSSQTSASQAGILLGSNEGIPAFRWWDKPRQELLVSSSRTTAQTLESALSTGNGLLAHGGAGRWNAFSGNAAENIGVYSVFGDPSKGSANTLLGYLLSPYMLSRILTLFVVDVVREWWQAWQQRRQNVLPRVHRGLKYSFIRAGTTTAMQEASRHILTADVLRGTPAVYNTFFGYDEVAHHSGIDRADSLKILTTLDTIFAHLERVARAAPRPYHLIVLSDHGQSQGTTFLQKYGLSLADLTHQLVAPDGATRMMAMLQTDEAMGHVNVALSEAVQGVSRTAAVLRRVLKPRMSDGEVALGQPKTRRAEATAAEMADVVVLASGNLGVISFPGWPERMSLEQLDAAFPRLIAGLVDHPGIAFALVHSEEYGPLAVGETGAHHLRDGVIDGEDPLIPFGPNATRHLLREAEFANIPELVISEPDPVSGEVPAFEELVGNHGGLGGSQREPFLLYPDTFDPGAEEIVGAGHLHDVLKGWIEGEQGGGDSIERWIVHKNVTPGSPPAQKAGEDTWGIA
ncbi:MAG: phage holin family protein, partial [Chloroflexia bacterium]|nr:phage holin family protein [Chloroflexia bacterium]